MKEASHSECILNIQYIVLYCIAVLLKFSPVNGNVLCVSNFCSLTDFNKQTTASSMRMHGGYNEGGIPTIKFSQLFDIGGNAVLSVRSAGLFRTLTNLMFAVFDMKLDCP
jgi:hypothetical protein